MRQEALGGGISVTVSDMHTFGTDAVLLAAFACAKKNTVACDLGSGCGIIPLLFCRDGLCKHITAVEIQEDACEQIRDAAERHRLDKLSVLCRDLRQLSGNDLPLYSFDLVTMNPPYKAPRAGLQSRQEAALLARHEVACTLPDITAAAAKLLRFGGRLCICHRPERLTDAICCMRESGIEPKRIRLLCHNSNSKPSLFFLEGKKGAGSGMVIEPPLFLKNMDGTYTEQALKMYGLYRNERTSS